MPDRSHPKLLLAGRLLAFILRQWLEADKSLKREMMSASSANMGERVIYAIGA
jgi:hypothetical protein